MTQRHRAELSAERSFATAELMNEALAETLARRLAAAIESRGRALLAVSGGKSPIALFQGLSQHSIPWRHVVVTLVDERWVDAAHADSNERLVREHLLRNAASEARFLGLKNTAPTAAQGQAHCERMLRDLPRPFDAIVLGMGEDGHTASLFPAAPQLASALDLARDQLCAAVDPPAAPHPRMSLSLRGLLDSHALFLPLSGAGKRATLDQALSDGAVEEMPIRAVLRQRQVPLHLWTADR